MGHCHLRLRQINGAGPWGREGEGKEAGKAWAHSEGHFPGECVGSLTTK